jgi:hypothetical protein
MLEGRFMLLIGFFYFQLNMSGFGKNLLQPDSSNDDDNSKDDEDKSVFDKFTDKVDEGVDKVKGGINDIANDAADKLADELGISEWYSVHLMDYCEGAFKPDASAPSPGFDVTECSKPSVGAKVNLTDILGREIDAGPLDISLADLDWPEGIQKRIDALNDALTAVTVFYLLGMGLAGVCLFVAAADFAAGALPRRVAGLVTTLGAGTSALGTLSMTVGSAITTASARQGAEIITDVGSTVGVSATAGNKFIILSWVGTGLIAVCALVWVPTWWKNRRTEKKLQEKPGYVI